MSRFLPGLWAMFYCLNASQFLLTQPFWTHVIKNQADLHIACRLHPMHYRQGLYFVVCLSMDLYYRYLIYRGLALCCVFIFYHDRFSMLPVHKRATRYPYRSGVGVTKPISSVPLFSEFFSIIKTHVTYWISRLYLTGVAAAQLRWHLSNINVIRIM